MKKFFFVVVLFFQVHHTFAQGGIKHRIAVFAPLYLDSAFDDNDNYRYAKQFPKFISPGLEFYEGVELALDSLGKERAEIEVYIYDTRSLKETLSQQLEKAAADSVEMFIAYATPQETWSISSAARTRKIPYINVNLPNDAGVSNNPYFVMLNSTLRTHVDQVYRYIQKYYSLDPIIVFRKKGQMEDAIKTYLDDNSKSTMAIPLKIKYVDLIDSFSVNQLTAQMDSNKHTLCVAGSLDENFGRRLSLQLASIAKSYPLTLIGMPTFDNVVKDFTKPEFKGLEVVYSTPFYNERVDKISQQIVNTFNAKMYARPSDMVMRGYEAMWRFSKLLMLYGPDITSNLSRKEFNVFREFDIQPVINRATMTLDYFENKKLYFIKKVDGVVKTVY